MKRCKRCKKKLVGEMIFYPTICLSCVIDLVCIDDKKELKKYEKEK
jgi:hypothetical protein